jgi:hypothetical protein
MKKCKNCSCPEKCEDQEKCEKIVFLESLKQPVVCKKEVCDCKIVSQFEN